MTTQDTTSPAYMYARRQEKDQAAKEQERFDTIWAASRRLIGLAEYKFEQLTQHSYTDRSDWSLEQKCRYGDEQTYELALKLQEMI